MDRLVTAGDRYKMKVNIRKKKVMLIVTKTPREITINRMQFGQVLFVYHQEYISSDCYNRKKQISTKDSY